MARVTASRRLLTLIVRPRGSRRRTTTFADAKRLPASDFDEQLRAYDERDAERAERFETIAERMRREHY